MKILVVDDHPLVREAMAGILNEIGESIRFVDAADCASALAVAREHVDISLVLLDLNLPGARGFEALDRFRRAHPTLPVVILSMHHDRESIREALRHGANGYIPKASPTAVIINAVRLVLAGGVYVPPDIVDEHGSSPGDPLEFARPARARSVTDLGLTPRQGQVLALIMRGRSNKEICRALGLAERTVKVHVTAVLTALRVSSRTQAVIAASALGLSPDGLMSPGADTRV